MTEPTAPETKAEEPTKELSASLGQLLIDLGPIAVFAITYVVARQFHHDGAIYPATGAFIIATLLAIAYSWIRTRHVPPMLIVTGILVSTFGGLTILLHDENFVKLKPTVMYLFFSASIFISMLFGQNVWKLLFQHAFSLPDRIWRILAIRWGLFFIVLAAVNEYIRLNMSTDFWVAAKFPIFIAIVAFGVANAPLTMKYAGQTEE